MSHFSAVDDSPDPSRLLAYLDASASGLAAMKNYVAAAAARAVPGGTVLDIGCGAAHDLVLLADRGLVPVGIDPSAVMMVEAARRLRAARGSAQICRADGAGLPFRSAALDGCRIERVLQHTIDPQRVLDEAGRILRPGGFLAVFEPDWTALSFSGQDPDDPTIVNALLHVRQPAIGAELRSLIAARGFRVLDEVTELSFADALGVVPLDLDGLLQRAVDSGRLLPDTARDWRARQAERERHGCFQASWKKILVVAEKL